MHAGEDDDEILFRDAMSDVKPLPEPETVIRSKRCILIKKERRELLEQEDNFLSTDFLEILPLELPLGYRREGIQEGVAAKLRAGKYPLEATLNLLRCPVRECRVKVFSFIQEARKSGARTLLIIHGKGRSDSSHANIVRSFLARWLAQFDDVQAYSAAQLRHGGPGACYVALKKSERAKMDNWEQHAKRSR